MTDKTSFESRVEILKADTDLGLVLGWGIICKQDGEPYFDTQNDHAPEDSMLEAVTEFMKTARIAGRQHTRNGDGDKIVAGTVVHSFPLTTDIAKAFGIACDKTGWMVAVKPDDPEDLSKFQTGEYTGFSIGGAYVVNEAVS